MAGRESSVVENNKPRKNSISSRFLLSPLSWRVNASLSSLGSLKVYVLKPEGKRGGRECSPFFPTFLCLQINLLSGNTVGHSSVTLRPE